MRIGAVRRQYGWKIFFPGGGTAPIPGVVERLEVWQLGDARSGDRAMMPPQDEGTVVEVDASMYMYKPRTDTLVIFVQRCRP